MRGRTSLLQGLLTTQPPKCFISSQGRRYQLADAFEGHCRPGVTWAGTGCCLLESCLCLWFIHLSYLFVDFFAAFPGQAESWRVAGHISTGLWAVARWLLTAGGAHSRQPQHPQTARSEHKPMAPSHLSSRHTFLSLLPVLLMHFSPLGNKAFLISATSNTLGAQKNFWVGGSLCCTVPCLHSL